MMQRVAPGPSGSFESPLIPEASEPPGGEPDADDTDLMLILGALLDELGLVWCAEHSMLEPVHNGEPTGTNMGFPQPEGEVQPGPM